MQGGGSPHQVAYTRLHVELSGRCEPKRCCLTRFRAVCTPTQHRVGPLTVDQGKIGVAPNRGGPVLTVRGPRGILPSG